MHAETCTPKQRPTQKPHKQWVVYKTINQQQQNHSLRKDSILSHRGNKCILLAPKLRHSFCFVKTQKLFSFYDQFFFASMPISSHQVTKKAILNNTKIVLILLSKMQHNIQNLPYLLTEFKLCVVFI